MRRWITLILIILGLATVVLVFHNINREKAAEQEAKLGQLAFKDHDFDLALAHFTQAVKIYPNARYWTGVATTHFRRGDYLESAQASTRALACCSWGRGSRQVRAGIHELRGTAYATIGLCKDALTDYEAGMKLKPSARLKNSLAWLLATAVDPSVLDGERAVCLALETCREDKWSNAGYIDTLAAAYARAGQFKEAIQYEERAMRLENGGSYIDYRDRLGLYQKAVPYTEKVRSATEGAGRHFLPPPGMPGRR